MELVLTYYCKYYKALKKANLCLPGWRFKEDQLKKIGTTLDELDRKVNIFPEPDAVLRCFYNLSPIDIKVVILGQDCYHTPGMADGLAFSTKNARLPPSLRNIFSELKNDVDIVNNNGNLYNWKKQGVLLLNTYLTVEQGKPNSHSKIWEGFSESVLKYLLSRENEPRVYILWGKFAQDCFDRASNNNINSNLVLRSAHPSPFSADRGFFGSKPFSKTNEFLKSNNIPEINWSN